jgi:hypothetical protein
MGVRMGVRAVWLENCFADTHATLRAMGQRLDWVNMKGRECKV